MHGYGFKISLRRLTFSALYLIYHPDTREAGGLPQVQS